MIKIATPVVRFPFGSGEATVIFPMTPEDADNVKNLVRTLVCDCVLDRSVWDGEDDCYVAAEYRGVMITAGHIESVLYWEGPQYGLRLDLESWEPGDLDYTQAPTELCLDARLAAAAAVRVILEAAAI